MACIGENTFVAFVDGTLDAAARTRVEAHVAGCPPCRAVLSEVGRSSLVAGAALDAAPEGGRVADGTVLAERYRITRFIARGGMGEVYEAEDLELHAPVALKMMRPEMTTDPRAVERFKRETHLARRVTHPNVCRIFDVGFVTSGDAGMRVPFLTMELLEGETLSEWLSRVVRLTTDEALPLAAQLAAALQAAHDAGVVHRDFKSANIVLVPSRDEGGLRAVVTDFGVARASDGIDIAATSSSARGIVGSPGYMAPEQLQGQEATAAADVYAYGVVLYEMVTGHLPFEAETPLLTALRRIEHPPTSPRVYVPQLGEHWESVLLRCLAREPTARFASARAAYEALGGGGATRFVAPARAREPASAALAATVRRKRARSSPSQAPASELVARRPVPRGSAWATAIGLAALSVGIGVAAWKHQGARQPVPASAPAVATPAAAATTPAVTATTTAPPTAQKAPTEDADRAQATVLVRSEPPGASVTMDGKPVGVTPLTLSIAPPRDLVLSLPGYRPVRRHVAAAGTVNVRLLTLRPAPTTRLLDE